jgi:hypothetical protein
VEDPVENVQLNWCTAEAFIMISDFEKMNQDGREGRKCIPKSAQYRGGSLRQLDPDWWRSAPDILTYAFVDHIPQKSRGKQ